MCVTIVVVAAWLVGDSAPEETGTGLYGSSSVASPEATSAAPAVEVSRLHQALHSIGRSCASPAAARSPSSLRRDVDVILTFAKRYPQGRFAVDDETGSALSLLLATREDLRACSPALAALVNRELPPELRDSGELR